MQGRCITFLPRPRRWQAASVLPGVSWILEIRPRADAQPVNDGAVAGSCTRTSSLAGRYSPLKSQPRKVKGPGAFRLPAHAISTKNKHLLLSCDTNPRFHGGSFGVCPLTSSGQALSDARSAESKGVWGTPPAKPLDCKIRLNSSGALAGDRWADPTGGEPRLSRAALIFLPGDIV